MQFDSVSATITSKPLNSLWLQGLSIFWAPQLFVSTLSIECLEREQPDRLLAAFCSLYAKARYHCRLRSNGDHT